ncbi:MAG: 16S rRNA (guanine(966)-N(2))-methyltransferase RsmD [Roseimicrobium sp.]
MRIISGTAGSMSLKVPASVARPTTDRVREAVFSMLGEAVAQASVLDLFAGSGAMGLECLSRGALSAQFVEQHSGACAVIEDNLKRSALLGGRVVKADAFAALRRWADDATRFDLIIADPPYAKKPGDTDFAGQLLASQDLRRLLAPGGLFVLETMVTKRDSSVIAGWDVVRDRAYGSTRILILQTDEKNDVETAGAAVLQPGLSPGPGGDGPGGMEENDSPRWASA